MMLQKILIVCLVLFFNPVAFSEQIKVHVAADGNDDWLGTREKPFATLDKARDAIRIMRASGNTNSAIVLIGPGFYARSAPLELNKRDNNTTFSSSKTNSVRISGGVKIDIESLPVVNDEAIVKRLPEGVRTKVRVIDLTSVSDGETDPPWPDAFRGYAGWPEVYVDGKPLHLARWPNKGYAKIEKVIDRGSRPRHQEKPDRPGAFRFKESDPTTWDADQEIFLGGYWCFSWYDEVLRVKSINPEKKVIHFAFPHHYGIGGPSKGKYYSINVLETLDQPGEYVYDRKAGKIYLLPPEGESKEFIVGLLQGPLISIKGASGIEFKGLQFEAGRSNGIEIVDCNDIVIENCVIRNFPKNGINIRGGKNCGVKNSDIYGLGMTGIVLDGGDRSKLSPSGHYAIDNEIHHYARLVQTYNPGVRLSGVGNRVAFNYIHHSPHQAICFGGNDHIIENNRIEEVCLDTGDAGAIYCGRDWTLQGNIIRKNWFSNIGKGAHHNNWAVYPDDQASGITAKHNIIVDCPSGFLFGGGRDSVIEGNLFVKVGKWPIRFDKRGIAWKGKHEKTLQQKLAAVPVDKEPWRTRFPQLLGLSTNPKRNWPEGNIIRGNIAVDSSTDNIDSKVKEFSKVEDTIEIKSDWMPRLENGKVIFPENGPKLPLGFNEIFVGPRIKNRRKDLK